jgi:hypothetical protein
MQTVSDNSAHIWEHTVLACKSNDWLIFQQRLLAIAHCKGFAIETLGFTAGQPIYLMTRTAKHANAKNILVASGFHGEEPAGPWGLLKALDELATDTLDQLNLAVLPLVNVSGFSRGTRFNHQGENPNRGFLPHVDGIQPTEEGAILLAQQARIIEYGRDGAISCHEDQPSSHCYLYANEQAESPGVIARSMLACNAGFFPVHPDGHVDNCPIQAGIVFNEPDSSFEGWMLANGSQHTFCTETPGQFAFETRVAANAAMISLFMDMHR